MQYLRKLCNHPGLVLTPNHPLYSPIIERLTDADAPLLSTLAHAPKLVALSQLLQGCCGAAHEDDALQPGKSSSHDVVSSGHRFLIFSQQKSMLDLIQTQLLDAQLPGLTYLRLDGNVEPSKRGELVQKFNSDPTIDLMLLTTHVGGLGLNLTGADTVVFMDHDWNPQKDLQAMDRAHRIGQTRTVNVYRLICVGTLEEKIMGLQQFKLNLANSVVNQQNSSMLSMGTSQLLDLMQYSNGTQDEAQNKSNKFETNTEVGIKAVLEDLGELWDEDEYTEEYDLTAYIAQYK